MPELMSEDDPLITRIAAELREPVTVDAYFDDQVMETIRGLEPHRRKLWVLQPQTIRVRPITLLIGGLAAAAIVMGLTQHRAPAKSIVATAVAPTNPTVRFVLVAPHAHRVALVGDFNHWNPNATMLAPVGESSSSTWSTSVQLTPGRHAYAFMIDDAQWVADPAAPQSLDDDYGTPTSTVTVVPSHGQGAS